MAGKLWEVRAALMLLENELTLYVIMYAAGYTASVSFLMLTSVCDL